MLVKKFEDEPGDPGFKIWRYWCDCLYPTHVLELVEHGEIMEFSIVVQPGRTLWCRIKMAWDMLRGRESQYTDVVISKEDREEIANILKGNAGV